MAASGFQVDKHSEFIVYFICLQVSISYVYRTELIVYFICLQCRFPITDFVCIQNSARPSIGSPNKWPIPKKLALKINFPDSNITMTS